LACTARGGTLENNELSPSAIVGCAKAALARLEYERPANIAMCTASQDFAGGSANHRKAKDAIVAVANKSFHKALSLIGRLRPEYRVHRQPSDAVMTPWRSASPSLSPTWASGGSVNMQ
jgi:hypothetical protein